MQCWEKMYSNTMMVSLNSRVVYGIPNDTVSNELLPEMTFRKFGFIHSQVGISVTHERRSGSLERPLEDSK